MFRRLICMAHQLRHTLALIDNWRVPQLTRLDQGIIIATIAAVGYFRGFDYSYGQDSAPAKPIDGRPPTVFLLSEILPLPIYGYLIFLFLSMLVIGWILKWHQMIWWGHGWCWLLWLVLFVGTLVPIFSVPYLDGLRGATSLIPPTVIHFIFWIRTGSKPLTRDEIQ